MVRQSQRVFAAENAKRKAHAAQSTCGRSLTRWFEMVEELVESVRLVERAKRKERLGALERPEHPRLLEALPDDGPASALDDARADEPAVRAVFVVFHSPGVAAIVLEFAHRVLAEPVAHVLPDVVEHSLDLARLDALGPVVVAVLPFPRDFLDPEPEHQRLEVLYRVPDVEYLDGEEEVAVVDGVQPLAPGRLCTGRFPAASRTVCRTRSCGICRTSRACASWRHTSSCRGCGEVRCLRPSRPRRWRLP